MGQLVGRVSQLSEDLTENTNGVEDRMANTTQQETSQMNMIPRMLIISSESVGEEEKKDTITTKEQQTIDQTTTKREAQHVDNLQEQPLISSFDGAPMKSPKVTIMT